MDENALKQGLEGDRLSTLQRIAQEISTLPKQPDEFTATEVADAAGIEYKTAVYRLKKLEGKGELTSRKPGNERYYRYVIIEE